VSPLQRDNGDQRLVPMFEWCRTSAGWPHTPFSFRPPRRLLLYTRTHPVPENQGGKPMMINLGYLGFTTLSRILPRSYQIAGLVGGS
jgi:hypothetical protein